MVNIEIIGFCAMCLGALKHIPQLQSIEAANNFESFSKNALLISIFVSVLWVYYGIKKKSNVVVIGAVGSIFYEFYILCKILKSERDKKE